MSTAAFAIAPAGTASVATAATGTAPIATTPAGTATTGAVGGVKTTAVIQKVKGGKQAVQPAVQPAVQSSSRAQGVVGILEQRCMILIGSWDATAYVLLFMVLFCFAVDDHACLLL